jgi:LemA protein
MMKNFKYLLILTIFPIFMNCGYNTIVSLDEEVNSSWSEVLNQYKRRYDLVPSLVQTVKGYAGHEKEVLESVSEARARMGSIQATPELIKDPALFQKFTKAQSELGSAISRLLVVTENYPNLKADAAFQGLMSQLEGTENRIAVARGRYIEKVKEYNTTIRQFPSNLTAKFFSFETKPNFSLDNEQEMTAPKVEF